jgi:hypothetical protein
MKKLILPILISSFFLSFGQENITKDVLRINTHERNSKNILFEKKTSVDDISFVLKAENQSTKDFTKCKWITLLSAEELIDFLDVLENIDIGSSVENSVFKIAHKKNRIKVQIKNTKCTSEHKVYYFQQSCKRELSFIILPNETSEIISVLKKTIVEINYVIK